MSVPTSCRGCGACCCFTLVPPYTESERRMLRATEPALAAELDAYEAGIVEPGGSPVMPEEGKCVWYDSGEAGSEAESGFCKHWKERPEACENFELGGERCVSLRKLLSVDDVGVPWRRKMAAAGEEIP